MLKSMAFMFFMVVFLGSHGFAQLLVSAGANGYLGKSGLMIGGGAEVEMGYGGCFGGTRFDDITTLGIGLEYLYLQTEFTQQPGGAFILPVVIKRRFVTRSPIAYDLGLGIAWAIIDTENETDHEVTSSMGIAAYAETDFNYLLPSNILFRGGLRGGIVYIEDQVLPFFGLKIYAGYLFPAENPEEEPAY
jgi:hypothetical protein